MLPEKYNSTWKKYLENCYFSKRGLFLNSKKSGCRLIVDGDRCDKNILICKNSYQQIFISLEENESKESLLVRNPFNNANRFNLKSYPFFN